MSAISVLSKEAPVVFPCHPRTRERIYSFNMNEQFQPLPTRPKNKIKTGFFITDPLDYDDFLFLWKDAALVLTDSGGLQEETTALKIPCITMRENTERPVTVEVGSNIVAGTDAQRILELGRKALAGDWKQSATPSLWDGLASKRVVEILREALQSL
jgi:UDP-N-acetylglucosamine 2-epimerase (non-hydrolysing)